jgi:hypothetical protein
MKKLTSLTRRLKLWFLGIFPAFKKAKAGNTKSKGVNPTRTTDGYKISKNGIAAEIRVMMMMYIGV